MKCILKLPIQKYDFPQSPPLPPPFKKYGLQKICQTDGRWAEEEQTAKSELPLCQNWATPIFLKTCAPA